MPGEEVCVLSRESGEWKLDVEALKDVLVDHLDIPVAVLTVYGNKRTGKSFLLNKILQYLDNERCADWLERPDPDPGYGFCTRGGDRGCTEGIRVWSRVFLDGAEAPGGRDEPTAVLLMDTQGCFDASAKCNEDVLVFTLAASLSSTLVYNVRKSLDESKFRVLDEFLECGTGNQKNGRSKNVHDENESVHMFQKMMFLLRDWQSPKSIPYGLHRRTTSDGTRPPVCQPSDDKNFLLKKVYDDKAHVASLPRIRRRRDVLGAFEDVEAFLLPHPGADIATWEEEGMCSADMRPEFAARLGELVEHLLEGIKRKRLSGDALTGRELLEWMGFVARVINGAAGFHVRMVNEATCRYLVSRGQQKYRRTMMGHFQMCMPDERSFRLYHQLVTTNIQRSLEDRLAMRFVDESIKEHSKVLAKSMEHYYLDFAIMMRSIDGIGNHKTDREGVEFKKCLLNLLMASSCLSTDDEGDEIMKHLKKIRANNHEIVRNIRELHNELLALGSKAGWAWFKELFEKAGSRTVAAFQKPVCQAADENKELLDQIEKLYLGLDVFRSFYIMKFAVDRGDIPNLLTSVGGSLEPPAIVTPALCGEISAINKWFDPCFRTFLEEH